MGLILLWRWHRLELPLACFVQPSTWQRSRPPQGPQSPSLRYFRMLQRMHIFEFGLRTLIVAGIASASRTQHNFSPQLELGPLIKAVWQLHELLFTRTTGR